MPFNISDELDAMQRHYDKIVSTGGTAAMISLNSVGLAATKKICDRRGAGPFTARSQWPLKGVC